MSYFSLARRVPEASAVEPQLLTWLYDLIVHVPLVRTVHRRFVNDALALGVTAGLGLDLGTGPGYVACEIARQRPGLSFVGLDLAAHMVERASRQAARAGLNSRGLWPQGDGHRLPFPDDSFDLVVSSFSLHHWDDPLRILNEIARVLKPGGCYSIADLCREPGLFHRLFAYASIPAVSLPFGSYRGYGGYYESLRAGYTRAEAQSLMERSALPPGKVDRDSTLFVPILTIASKGAFGP
jgi:ubiquinone/menaquinone biosynthesis C-methylase UbiE